VTDIIGNKIKSIVRLTGCDIRFQVIGMPKGRIQGDPVRRKTLPGKGKPYENIYPAREGKIVG
jgi:hypothetical protein